MVKFSCWNCQKKADIPNFMYFKDKISHLFFNKKLYRRKVLINLWTIVFKIKKMKRINKKSKTSKESKTYVKTHKCFTRHFYFIYYRSGKSYKTLSRLFSSYDAHHTLLYTYIMQMIQFSSFYGANDTVFFFLWCKWYSFLLYMVQMIQFSSLYGANDTVFFFL